MSEWWRDFFDADYLRISHALFPDSVNEAQAGAIWQLLELTPGARLLDAPCGYGRLSSLLAERGAVVTGVDQSEVLIAEAERTRGGVPPERLRYVRHDLREPLADSGFDAVINVFTSFGYGTEEEDLALFRNLRDAVRPGGKVLIETNHRDLMCSYIARGAKLSMRMSDGTIFLDEPVFDALSGVVTLRWYWSGPAGAGHKEAYWRAYTPTGILQLASGAGLRFVSAHQGLTSKPYAAEGPEAGGRLGLIFTR